VSALPSFLEALKRAPLVFDGAMGTLLYERGVYLNRSFEELCLSRRELVQEIHRDYLQVGCDVVTTNTYGANALSLASHDLQDSVVDICKAAVELAKEVAGDRAWVAGSVGPTGLLPKDLLRNRTRREAFDAFKEQTEALVDAGADLLVFETFGYLGEIEIAIEAAYACDVPIVAQVSFLEAGVTLDGASPGEVKARLLDLGVDVIGANCVLGPEKLLEFVEPLLGDVPVIMQPNAGYPRSVDGRAIYMSSPETMGVIARRAFKKGVRAFGGCCGTGPEHMRRVVAACRMMGGGRSRWADGDDGEPPVSATEKRAPQVPLEDRSRLGAKLARGEFAVSVEISPPLGLDPARVMERIKTLQQGGVDVVNIPDGPRATVRMSNMAMARLVMDETDVEPIVHFCGRDRNLLGLQSDLLGGWALGVKNLVVITGDPPKVGDYPDATAVFDLDSVGMLHMASGLNAGFDPAGKPIGGATGFVLATGAEPAALDFDREIRRLKEKREAGADVVMTQPVYDPEVLERFLDAIAPLDIPVMVGILPLASSKNAEFLHHNVPGMRVPEEVRKRMAAAGDNGRAEGLAIATEALRAVRARVQGVYFMPPFGRVESALEILEQL
jgi:methionine synthase I (cobalamin-dependent)/5,10-methylenetetrahydrofolate reductase